MAIIQFFLGAVASLLHTVIGLYTLIIIVAALLSWIRFDPYNPFVRALRALTDPILWRVRKYLPFTYISGLDLSPVVVILALQFLDQFLVRSLEYLARAL